MAPSDHLRQLRENGRLQNVKHQACENLRNTFQSPGLSPAHTGFIQTEEAELAEEPRCGFPVLGLAASSHQKPWGRSKFL